MYNDEEKEFDPSESEDFIKAINDVLELPEEPENETINLASSNSQLIRIPDTTEETELTDREVDEYDAAIANSIADLFGDITNETEAVEETDDIQEDTLVATDESDMHKQTEDTVEQESLDDYIVSLDESMYMKEEFPREDQLGEEEIFDDINAALALQVNEMDYAQVPTKKTKKWLLTLIPLAGIVLLFTKVRQGMPKWLMGLRIAVFSVFAAFMLVGEWQVRLRHRLLL